MSSKWLLVLTFIAFLQLAISATLERPSGEVEDVINKNWKPVATSSVDSVTVGEDAAELKGDSHSIKTGQGYILSPAKPAVNLVSHPRPTAVEDADPIKVGKGTMFSPSKSGENLVNNARPTAGENLVSHPRPTLGENLVNNPRPTAGEDLVNNPDPVNPAPSAGVDSVNGDEEARPISNIGSGSNKIDTSYYYRLTNNFSGVSRALDVVNDARNYALKMAPIGQFTGQFWYFVHLGNNVYNLRTKFLGNKYSLDIVNDGVNDKPHMALTGNFSGQRWRLVRLNDGTFRFHNEFSGHKMFLDVARNTHVPRMFNNNVDYSGQHWTFNRLGKI